MFTILFIIISIAGLTLWKRGRQSRQTKLAERLGGPPGCPILGHVHYFLKKEFLEAMMEMDSTYFGVARFWFGPKLIVGINDPSIYEEVLNNKSALDKGDFYHFMRPLFGDGLIASDSKIWQINRKVVAPTLNALKVKTLTDVFVDGSEKLVEDWVTKIGLKFEPYADVSKTAFAFTLRTALGRNTHLPEKEMEKMIDTVNKISAGVSYRFIRPWLYPEWIFNLTPTGKKVCKDTEIFRTFLQELIKLKAESPEDEDEGFISHILGATKTNEAFQDKAVLDELSTYMTAGFETTSTALTFTLVMLGCHPQLQERVYQEQLAICESSHTIGWEEICKMEYLERFIKETMRLFPVITVIGRQLTDDVIVAKKVIPEGAFALIPTYAIHRNPNLWVNPETFDPDRFLPENENGRHHLAFLPFGAGPRICMGQKYALSSMKALIASVIRKFKIETNYSMEDIRLSKSVTLNTQGLTIELETRKRAS